MAFRLITGERGAGKSLELSEQVYKHNLNGDFCVTNFTHSHSNLDLSALSPMQLIDAMGEIIDFKDAEYEACDLHPGFHHTGVYFAFDEGTLYFGQEMIDRMKKEFPERYESFILALTQARKYDFDCDIVVQDPAKISKDVRRFIDEAMRIRWLLKWNLKINIPHPTKPTNRREWRPLIPFCWHEVHKLDIDNPKFNVKKDKDGNYTNKSTLIHRTFKWVGKKKRFYYRMYHSYQRLAVGQREFKGLNYLRNFTYVNGAKYKPESLPTLKAWLRWLGFNVKNNDAELPMKYSVEEIILPTQNIEKPALTEVQLQGLGMISSKELQKSISRAYGAIAKTRGGPVALAKETRPLLAIEKQERKELEEQTKDLDSLIP